MDPLNVIRTQSDRFAEVLTDTDPQARVPSCPEWNASDLLWHLTEVHLFWAGILADDVRSEEGVEAVENAKPERPGTTAAILPLREQATDRLVEQLAQLDDSEPRWSWWGADQTVGFTRRMQVCEATMHRVDAELTAQLPISAIEPELAGRLVDQCADVMWGWLPDWARYEPRAVVRIEATDSGRDWLLEIGHWTGTGPESGQEFDMPRAVRAPQGAEPQGVAHAPAEDLALWAWSRGGTAAVGGTDTARTALSALIEHGID